MNTTAISLSNEKVKVVLIDLLALLFIAFTPALSHMLAIPIYILEPMRILLILSIVHTSRKNSYLIALALPIFSFIISTHPSIAKTLLMSSELLINVFLFSVLLKNFKNTFAAMLASILISKIYYYTLKIGLISLGFISGNLLATPIYIQIIVALVLSTYLFLFYKTKK
jgi:hypothetical protein